MNGKVKFFKVMAVMLAVSLAGFNVFAETAAQKPSLGDGSQENPYQISTLAHLRWLSETDSVRMRHFVQTADIDAYETKDWNYGNGKGLFPIGDGGKGANYLSGRAGDFSGTYDGGGYVINNLYINSPSDSYVGLFGGLNGSAAKVHNLILENADITGDNYVGGICGNNNGGTISECYVTGKGKGTGGGGGWSPSPGFGIFVGGNSGTIINCYAIGNLKFVGGNSGTITNCYAIGNFVEAGGLVWYNSGGGTSKTTEEMKQKATFDGWDFDNVWEIKEGVFSPYLRKLGVDVIDIIVPSGITYTGDEIKFSTLSTQLKFILQGIDPVSLTENTDYTVSYFDNINAGTARAVITGIGDYSFIKTKTIFFTINKRNVNVNWVYRKKQ